MPIKTLRHTRFVLLGLLIYLLVFKHVLPLYCIFYINSESEDFVKSFDKYITNNYFNQEHDFRVQIFNLFAFTGIGISIVMTLQSLIMQTGLVDTLAKAFSGIASLIMVIYCERTKQYQRTYLISVFTIFILFFSIMFLTGGGYKSGISAFFVFAVVFTTCMLDGKAMYIMTILELLVYVTLCFIDFAYLDLVQPGTEESDFFLSIVICFVVASIAVGITNHQQVKFYKRQQAKLDEQNILLAQINRNKTEFLANTSHEMRTPLTVVSVNIQTVIAILNHMKELENHEDIEELLNDAQSEIMRLSRMVGGMLSLNSINEKDERHRTDFSELLLNVTDMLKLLFMKNNNVIILEQREKLTVFCNSDLISQVMINILQNANHHTSNDTIRIVALVESEIIRVSISDNGNGIPGELLPQVFERGVSEGGTGFGLYLCKTVVNSHGGNIWIKSKEGEGCTVTFTLPVYQGQYEGRKVDE